MQGTFCKDLDYWPFKSQCAPYRKDMEECAEDFECGITHFCWYASKADRDVEQKRCIEMYSQENGATFGWMQKGEDATIDDH